MRTRLRFVAPAIAILGLAGCHSDTPSTQVLVDNDYQQKHPIVVEPATALLRLGPEDAYKVSAEDRRYLHDFAVRFINRGKGTIAVSVGAQGVGDDDARAFAQDIAQDLLDEGVKASELKLEMVIADPMTRPGGAALRFSTTRVNLPPCQDWSEASQNAPSSDYGCSMQRNIGAMVADPRDLEQARESTGLHSTRGDAVIDNMNQGKATWSVPLPLAAATNKGTGASGGQ